MITIFQVSWTDCLGEETKELFKSKDSAVELLKILHQDKFVPGVANSSPDLRKFNIPETSEEFIKMLDMFEITEDKTNEK